MAARKQQTIDKVVKENQALRRQRASFWLFKHLGAELDLYEQSLVIFIWLHTGTKYANWVLYDDEIRTHLRCGRTKFYELIGSLKRRCLIDWEKLPGEGQRRYRLIESNLVETMVAADQRKYFELLGRSPGEIESLVESADRTANPPGGQRVREADAPYIGSRASHSAAESATPPPRVTKLQRATATATPGQRPQPAGDTESTAKDDTGLSERWAAAADILKGVEGGQVFALAATLCFEARELGLSPDDVADIAKTYTANRSKFEGPGAIAFRIRSGAWPADGVVEASTIEARREAKRDEKQREELVRAARQAEYERRVAELEEVAGEALDALPVDELREFARDALDGFKFELFQRGKQSELLRESLLQSMAEQLQHERTGRPR